MNTLIRCPELVTPGQLQSILATGEPYDRFFCFSSGKWIACDNREGNLLVEAFDSIRSALEWMKEPKIEEMM